MNILYVHFAQLHSLLYVIKEINYLIHEVRRMIYIVNNLNGTTRIPDSGLDSNTEITLRTSLHKLILVNYEKFANTIITNKKQNQ